MLYNVTETAFQTLLNDLGLRRSTPFTVEDIIRPVYIVGSSITLEANVSTPAFGTPASEGRLTAPAINTVLADTGELTEGTWDFLVLISFSSAVLMNVDIQHRNSGNTANVWAHSVMLGGASGDVLNYQFSLGKTVAGSERLRVLNLIAGEAGRFFQATIFSRLRS